MKEMVAREVKWVLRAIVGSKKLYENELREGRKKELKREGNG